MNFLADEDFPLTSTRLLREAGHDVAAVIEDSPSTRDIENLARAVQENRFLLTFDRDFGELIYKLKQPAPPGIFYFRFIPKTPSVPATRLLQLNMSVRIVVRGIRINPEEIVSVTRVPQELTEDSFRGKFTVVTIDSIRQRPLPGN